MKIAICFSGHARNYDEPYKTWEPLINNSEHDVHVYMHLWEDIGLKKHLPDSLDEVKAGLFPDDDKGVLDSGALDTNQIRVLFRPVKLVIEEYDYFDAEFQKQAQPFFEYRDKWIEENPDAPISEENKLPRYMVKINRVYANISQYYKIWAANNLKKEYEEMMNMKYDIVVRARTDIFAPDSIERMIPSSPDLLRLPTWLHPKTSVNDCYASGASHLMDIYSQIYTNHGVGILAQARDVDPNVGVDVHAKMKYHLDSNDIKYEQVLKEVKIYERIVPAGW